MDIAHIGAERREERSRLELETISSRSELGLFGLFQLLLSVLTMSMCGLFGCADRDSYSSV